MLKKMIFLQLVSGVILSPIGAYAQDDEGGAPRTSIARSYRLPVTELPSGEVELPSGTKLPSTTTAAGALKAMTPEDKILGQGLANTPLKPGATYITLMPDEGLFGSTRNESALPGFADIRIALERIEESRQQPQLRSLQQPGAFSPYVAGKLRTLRPELQAPSVAPTLPTGPFPPYVAGTVRRTLRPELEKAPSAAPPAPVQLPVFAR